MSELMAQVLRSLGSTIRRLCRPHPCPNRNDNPALLVGLGQLQPNGRRNNWRNTRRHHQMPSVVPVWVAVPRFDGSDSHRSFDHYGSRLH